MLALGLCALAGFLIGSVPTAYLLVKHRHGLDIHHEGSGNVGANNALRTSGSKWTGVLVLVGDALKGMAAFGVGSLLAQTLGADSFGAATVALLGAIAGHNYNPWLSLKAGRIAGGKGLATAAGGFALLLPAMLVVWGIGYVIGGSAFARWKGVKSSIPGNVVATAAVPFVGWVAYGPAVGVALTVFALLVLPKHAGQLQTLLRLPPGTPVEAEGTEPNP